jgi:hypothetical protein
MDIAFPQRERNVKSEVANNGQLRCRVWEGRF